MLKRSSFAKRRPWRFTTMAFGSVWNGTGRARMRPQRRVGMEGVSVAWSMRSSIAPAASAMRCPSPVLEGGLPR